MDPLKIAKLPVWAQLHIQDLQRERDIAVRELQEYCDNSTPSNIWTEELVSDGANKNGGPTLRTRYIQANKLSIQYAGARLEILLRPGREWHDVIDLQYGRPNRINGDVMLQPRSHQQFYLWGEK